MLIGQCKNDSLGRHGSQHVCEALWKVLPLSICSSTLWNTYHYVAISLIGVHHYKESRFPPEGGVVLGDEGRKCLRELLF